MGDREFRDFEKNLRRTPKKKSVTDHDKTILNDSQGSFTHPVYNTISYINGQINRMSLHEMKMQCKDLRLVSTGKREALKRRLKEHFKTEKLIEAGLMEHNMTRNVECFIVIDFEATCEERNPPGYPHEIIEFPAVLVSTATSEPQIVDVFHSYVRPVINPILSDFCSNLTGINQEVVDAAEPFPVVHERFLDWLNSHSLGITKSCAIVTDGPFDMGRFLFLQTLHLNMVYPSYAKHWTNLRKCFANFYKGDFYASQRTPQKLPGLQNMLTSLEMEFEGHPHSGVDDAKNIARVLIQLLRDGALIRVNEKIADDSFDDDNRGRAKLVSVTPVSRQESEEIFQRQLRRTARASKKEKLRTKCHTDELESKQVYLSSSKGSLQTEDSAILYAQRSVEDSSHQDTFLPTNTLQKLKLC